MSAASAGRVALKVGLPRYMCTSEPTGAQVGPQPLCRMEGNQSRCPVPRWPGGLCAEWALGRFFLRAVFGCSAGPLEPLELFPGGEWRATPPVPVPRAGGPSPKSQSHRPKAARRVTVPGFGFKPSRRKVPTSSHIPSQLLLQLLPRSTDSYPLPHSVTSAGPLLPAPRNPGVPSSRSPGAQEPRSQGAA